MRLELAGYLRDLALFNVAIDRRLRGYDLVKLTVTDLIKDDRVRERVSVIQSKTKKPVQFELNENTRDAVIAMARSLGVIGCRCMFPSRFHARPHISTLQYDRPVRDWVTSIGLEPSGYTGGAGRENINTTFKASQKRLQLDCIDLLYLHRFDADTQLEETFEALARLQQSGKIRHIGVSNHAAWQVVKAQGVAEAMSTRIDMIQPMYSLAKRQAEVELLPMAKSEGIDVPPYSPLGAGLLTGKDTRSGEGRLATDSRYAARYGKPWMHKIGQRFVALAAQMQVNSATLAVAWAAHHPSVTCPIISARTVDQLRPSLKVLHCGWRRWFWDSFERSF